MCFLQASNIEQNGDIVVNKNINDRGSTQSAMLEYFGISRDVLAITRIKKNQVQIGQSTSNLNQSYTCFRVTLVDCISVCETENENKHTVHLLHYYVRATRALTLVSPIPLTTVMTAIYLFTICLICFLKI